VIVEVPFVLMMPVVAAIIAVSVSVMVAFAVPEMTSPIIAIMVPVFCKGKPAEDQRQAQKNY
jgi:hypothetical protein